MGGHAKGTLALSQRSRANALAQHRGPNDPEAIAAKQEVSATMLRQHIEKIVGRAPALTAAQRVELARILLAPSPAAGGEPDGSAA
jgi:hypothetical protein